MNIKKIAGTFVLVMACAIVMSGCTKGGLDNISPAAQKGDMQGGVQSDDQNGASVATREGIQTQQSDMAGEIISVSGNSIDLKIIDMSSMPGTRNRQMDPRNRTQDGNSENNPPPGKNGDKQPDGSQPEQKQPDDRQPGQGQMELKYTGETKTITLPDDVSITVFGRGGDDGQQKTVAVNELKQGEILQLWYTDENKETISRATIMSFAGNAPDNN